MWPTSMPRQDLQRALAVGLRVAVDHVADVGDLPGSGRSRPQLTPVRWKPSSLAPQTKSLIAATVRSATTCILRRRRPGRYSRACNADASRISSSVAKRNAPRPASCRLDFVQAVVAAQQQQRERRRRCITAIALTVRVSGSLSSAATSSQVVLPGVGTFCIAAAGAVRAARRAQAPRPARRWRRSPSRAEGDRVLAGIGQHLELVRAGAADGAGVGRDGAELQAQAGEDARVGVVHVAVFALRSA